MPNFDYGSLQMASTVLDELESVRIANENRLRTLTRDEPDEDGHVRGQALPEDHPNALALSAIVTAIQNLEKLAIKELERQMKIHPLGPWLKAQRGIGYKQGARLLAAIGDPYVRPELEFEDGTVEKSRPRLVSELWSYSGYGVVDGKAKQRRKGQVVDWSPDARMRAFLIAASCVKQPAGTPWRDVYDGARAKYADATHKVECIRCGPKGKPALVGSPLSAGHQHARALRIVSKEVLKALWTESKRLHEG